MPTPSTCTEAQDLGVFTLHLKHIHLPEACTVLLIKETEFILGANLFQELKDRGSTECWEVATKTRQLEFNEPE